MTPYFIAFALPLLLYPLRKKSQTAYVFVLAGLWAVFAGLRDGIGGGDYFAYQNFYQSIRGRAIGSAYYFEPGFRWLAVAVKAAGVSYHGFLAVVALLGILPAVFVIDKRIEKPEYAAFALFIYGIEWMFYNSFVVLREGIALGLAFLALDSLLDGRKFKFVLICLAAACFHISAFVMMPLVFMNRELKSWALKLILALAILVIAGLEGGAYIFDYEAATGIVGRLLKFWDGNNYEFLNPLNAIEISAFIWLIWNYAGDSDALERNMYFIYGCIAIMSVAHSVIIRFGYYYEIALAFLLPRAAASKRAGIAERSLIVIGLTAYFLAKMARWLIKNSDDGFLPYRTILFPLVAK